MTDRPTRLLMVDDHDLFRTGLRSLLAVQPGCEVVGEARSAEEALRILAEKEVDVVLLDIGLPGMNGLAAMAEIRNLQPAPRIVVVSMHKDEEYVSRALKGGAQGYVLKEAGIEELLLAISSARAGHMFISPAISRMVAGPFASTAPGDGDALTPRQIEVLVHFAQGLSTREVAAQLALSPKTVESHRAQMMERLGLRNLASLVLYAVRHGYIRADEAPPS